MSIDEMWQALLLLAGGIVALIGAGSAIFKLFNPYKRIIKRLDELEKEAVHHAGLFEKDLRRFEANDERDCVMMDTLFAILEHNRTNNARGWMEEASKKMQAYLVHRK